MNKKEFIIWIESLPEDFEVDIGQEILFKGQCQGWAEMKYTWLELNGKAEEYFSKPWKRGLDYDLGN